MSWESPGQGLRDCCPLTSALHGPHDSGATLRQACGHQNTEINSINRWCVPLSVSAGKRRGGVYGNGKRAAWLWRQLQPKIQRKFNKAEKSDSCSWDFWWSFHFWLKSNHFFLQALKSVLWRPSLLLICGIFCQEACVVSFCTCLCDCSVVFFGWLFEFPVRLQAVSQWQNQRLRAKWRRAQRNAKRWIPCHRVNRHRGLCLRWGGGVDLPGRGPRACSLGAQWDSATLFVFSIPVRFSGPDAVWILTTFLLFLSSQGAEKIRLCG